MNAMALPALQETFDNLSAETRKYPDATPRGDEVVSFTMAKIIELVDGMVRRQSALRAMFIEGNQRLRDTIEHPAELSLDDLETYADVLVQMRRSRREFARPFFADASGYSSIRSLVDTLGSLELSRPADGRLARRQAERVSESAEACEAQRVEFVGLTDRVVALMEANVTGNEAFETVLVETIARHSVARFPVINEYLAR